MPSISIACRRSLLSTAALSAKGFPARIGRRAVPHRWLTGLGGKGARRISGIRGFHEPARAVRGAVSVNVILTRDRQSKSDPPHGVLLFGGPHAGDRESGGDPGPESARPQHSSARSDAWGITQQGAALSAQGLPHYRRESRMTKLDSYKL
jgi:hypothetical protein